MREKGESAIRFTPIHWILADGLHVVLGLLDGGGPHFQFRFGIFL
jgi:hypothetical protein